jgi:creatinine amidohydrolase
MQISLASSSNVQDYLKTRHVLILPLGATEQHGSVGLLGTDWICADAVAGGVGRKTGIAVAPTLALGMSQFHLGFAGTLTLTPLTLQAVIADVVRSAALQGFRRIYALNGHGGNIGPVTSAFQQVHAEAALTGRPDTDLRLRLQSWWQGPRTGALVDRLYGHREGFHVTASEISIVRHLHPHLVGAFARPTAGAGPVEDAIDHGTDQYDSPGDFRRRYPEGIVGSDPSLSRAAHGVALLQAAVEDMAEDVLAFEAAP